MSAEPKFALGQTVFVAQAFSYSRIEVPCPVCFGDKSVKVILGNGEIQPVECDACGLGYEEPRGIITAHAPQSSVFAGQVDGITRHYSGDGWRYSVNGSHYDHIFATAEEAESAREQLFEKAKLDAERTNESIAYSKKRSLAWKIRYHREQIKDAERRIRWSKEKLSEFELKKTKREGDPQ